MTLLTGDFGGQHLRGAGEDAGEHIRRRMSGFCTAGGDQIAHLTNAHRRIGLGDGSGEAHGTEVIATGCLSDGGQTVSAAGTPVHRDCHWQPIHRNVDRLVIAPQSAEHTG